ncbi:MAG: DNA translocase FtsK [Chitinophagaceae bacterium]|nr:DNA translocase FtsK [Chitinophagaceae bacterium]
MANSLKKKTPPPPDPEILNADKETEITVTEVVKDERTGKIAGAISLLSAIFLFIAFTSYLFTWQEDQDIVHQFGVKIFATTDVKVTNLLGVLGAYIAHLLIYRGFGLASYLFCTFFFVLGVNLLFDKKIYRITRNIKYVLIGILVLSMALAFVTPDSEFSWGGAVGELMSNWFIKWMGKLGTGAVLVMAVFSYFIWRFNPIFHLPVWKSKTDEQSLAEGMDELDSDVENPAITEWDQHENAAKLFIHDDATEPGSQNKLKNPGGGLVLNIPEEDTQDKNPMNQFGLQEKNELMEEEPIVTPNKNLNTSSSNIPLVPTDTTKPDFGKEDLELEIKAVPNIEEAAAANAATGSLATKYDATLDLKDYKYPTLDLLETHGSEKIVHDPAELETHKNQIIATLKNYDIAIQRIAATVGPTVTLYEIVPAPGVRISRIKNLEDDIALSLAALGIRIIAPIPGKGTIGIEVPNVRKSVVSMKTLLASDKFQNNHFSLPIAIGKKIDNENFIVDLASMPHLLMAGATGQGKSVGINTLLVSLLYKKHPSQLKFVLVDPKKVELSLYRVIEKHFLAKLPGEEESIITDTKKVVHTLNALCIEMDTRYDLLKEAGCRNIKEYNEKFTSRKLNPEKGHQYLPFIVLVVDEFADLIMTAGKEVEMPIARLAQLARAIGIHLIIATQRPSVNIITGTIKANFPARIAFKVSSKIDSRTILDAGGSEQLIGKGDMLISYNGEITRLQCAFVDTPEVEKVCAFIGNQKGYPQAFLLPEYVDEKDMEGRDFDSDDRDPLFEDAARLIVQSQIGSTSLIQRRMKLGYNRAGRLMDQLEAAGIVGPNQGSKAREVRYKTELELEQYLDSIA